MAESTLLKGAVCSCTSAAIVVVDGGVKGVGLSKSNADDVLQ